ncbi:ProQ domain-containing protein (plasmid) [Candidatus Megaera polyxenophila]|nr:ProQ domain-containing protein [Candidatus Megaera polyxenophila]
MQLVIKPKLKLTAPIVKKKETIVVNLKKIQKVKKEKKEKTPREQAEELRKIKIAAKVFNQLSRKFPDVFSATPKPLAIGIKDELFTASEELGLSKTNLRIFLNIYCRSKDYREARIVNAERINLKGEFAGLVTEKEANYFKEKQSNK